MTIAELIDLLKALPRDATVTCSRDDDGEYYPINKGFIYLYPEDNPIAVHIG